jgi:hypothetical protein
MNTAAHSTAFDPATEPEFPVAARLALANSQLRKNVRHATNVIQNKRASVAHEQTDWQGLRESGRLIREHTFAHLSHYLEEFELTFRKPAARCTGHAMQPRRAASSYACCAARLSVSNRRGLQRDQLARNADATVELQLL